MFGKLGRTATLALAFIALGFVFIGVAWNGAASVDFPSGQIPYLISGGAAGLGLIALGAGLLLFESGRRHLARLEAKFDALIDASSRPGAAAEEAAEKPAKPARSRATGRAPSANGVVIGRASFHRPDCRLVQGKEDLDFASPDEAAARGLSPCRVCEPMRVSR